MKNSPLPPSVFHLRPLLCLLPFAFSLCASAQIPLTVRQSDINNGAAITLPAIANRTFVSGYGDYHWVIASSNFTYSTPIIKIGGYVNGQASLENIGGANYGTSFMTFWSPTAVFTNGWSSPASQTLTGSINWNETDYGNHPYAATLAQVFTFYLVNDLTSSTSTVSLSVLPDYMESISRKTTSTDYRKLMGIYLAGSTNNLLLTSLAFAINNTSTNSASFSNLAFYRDSGSGQFSPTGSALLATTTNANGYAVFNNLSENLSATHQLYFLAGQFDPSQQSRNSFIGASLNSANVVAAYTNAVVLTTGGNFLGKQYGFLDTTDAEDAAASAAIGSQINKAIAAIPPAQTPKQSQLNAATLGIGAAAVGASLIGNQLIGGVVNQATGTVKGGPRPGYSEKY